MEINDVLVDIKSAPEEYWRTVLKDARTNNYSKLVSGLYRSLIKLDSRERWQEFDDAYNYVECLSTPRQRVSLATIRAFNIRGHVPDNVTEPIIEIWRKAFDH